MKLPLQISPAFPSDVCDNTGSLIAMCCDRADVAQIISAVNRHQSLVGALEVATALLEQSDASEHDIALCRKALLDALRDAVPHVLQGVHPVMAQALKPFVQ